MRFSNQARLLVDVDDTLLQFSVRLQTYIEDKLGIPAVKPVRDWLHADECFALSTTVIMPLIHAFWRDDVFGDLEPETCAKTVVPRLHEAGWRFVAITACPSDDGILQARRRNLKAAFGFDWEVFCVGPGGDKSRLLSHYENAVWVEDNGPNAVIGAELGHRTFLFDRPHNASFNHPGVMRVKDWHEVERELSDQT